VQRLKRWWLKNTRLEVAILVFIVSSNFGALVLPLVTPSAREKYRGHSLEYWLNVYRREEGTGAEAVTAIRALREESLGRAAFLFSTNRFAVRTSKIRWPSFVEDHPLFCVLAWDRSADNEYAEAELILELLGREARPLVPMMVESLADGKLCGTAVWALDRVVGQERELELVLRKGESFTQTMALGRIREAKWSDGTKEIVREFAKSSHPQVRGLAMGLLLARTSPAEAQQKLLLTGLADADAKVRAMTLEHLMRNPGEVWLALPEVMALTNSASCRTQALCALRAARLIKRGVVNEWLIPPPEIKERFATR
jgi:hypothetical protein